jgi:TRAP-type C4-dicarboxylate transport system permease small subunit
MDRLWDRLIDGLAVFAALLLGAMTLYVSYEVIVRYLLGAPTSWSNDLSEYTLVWSTFLAAPWLARRGGHVRIDLVIELLGPQTKRRLAVLVGVAAAAVCAIGAWETATETWSVYARGLVIARAWAVPEWIPYAAMPVGFALMVVEFLRGALRDMRAR